MIQVLDNHLSYCRNNEPAEHNGIPRINDPSMSDQHMLFPDEKSIFGNPSIHEMMTNNEKNGNLSQLHQIVNASTNETLHVPHNDISAYFDRTTIILHNLDDEEYQND